MEELVRVTYNVHHEIALGPLVANYFYMTGLSAGSFILSTLAYGFGVKKYKPIAKTGVVMATLLLVFAPLNLILELEQPLRFWELFFFINITSAISWGSFLLTLYPLNCVIYGWFMFKGNERMTKFFGLLGIPLALSVHGYTGFILALAKARDLWNTALMPTLFLVSAMVSGIALMIVVITIKDRFFSREKKVNKELIQDLANLLALSIVLDLALVGSDLLVLFSSNPEAYESAKMLLFGPFRPIFLGLEIGLGSFLPLLLLLFPLTRTVMGANLASLLVLVGIFAMRYVVVIGGQAIPQI